MEIISNYKAYNPATSVGVYYFNETQQIIGYWKSAERTNRKDNFVQVAVIEINCRFAEAIVAAVISEINNILN